MNRYVVDASVCIKWYVPEVHWAAAELLLDEANELHAPDLVLPEFGNIVWKKVSRGEVPLAAGRRIIKAFLKVPVRKHPAEPLSLPAFEIAARTGQTVYDCTYLTLAVALDCRMITADEKFYRAIGQTVLGKYLLFLPELP